MTINRNKVLVVIIKAALVFCAVVYGLGGVSVLHIGFLQADIFQFLVGASSIIAAVLCLAAALCKIEISKKNKEES